MVYYFAMKKLTAAALLLCLFCCEIISAQGTEVPVEVVVDKLSYSKIKGTFTRTTEAVYKLYHDQIAPANYLADKGCLIIVSREVEKNLTLAEDPVLAPLQKMKPFMISSTAESFKIVMEAYEDDKGEQCNYDKGDDSYNTAVAEIKLAELAPGVFSAPITLSGKEKKMSVVIRVRYGLPQPAPIKHKDVLRINSATAAVQLDSDIKLNNRKDLDFEWEYYVQDASEWKELGKTSSPSVEFFPIRDVFKSPIKTNKLVRFRMRAVSAELMSEYTEYEARFTPEVPQFPAAGITVTQSCVNTPTAILTLKEVKGVADQLSYYVIKGNSVNDQQYPDVISPVDKIKSGTIANGELIKVEGLGEGTYTIVVHNAGMVVGKFFSSQVFSVEKYPTLVIKSTTAKEASCSAAADGEIAMEVEGGNPSRFVFLITPATGKQQQFGRSVIFSDLLPGTYSIVVKDACSQLVTTDVEVGKKNFILTGKVAVTTEPVSSSDASAVITVAMQGGSGKYRYVVSKAGAQVADKEITGDQFSINKLTAGNYTIRVTDAASPKCPGLDTAFTIAPAGKTGSPVTVPAETKASPPQADSSREMFNVLSATSYAKSPERLAVYAPVGPARMPVGSFADYVKNTPGLKKYHIVIVKETAEMQVYNAFDNNLIVVYPVVFGTKEPGDKMFEGDRKTPEGEFKIIEKRVHEKWSRFLALSYPNEESIALFNERKSSGQIPKDARMGGDIGIHGIVASETPAIDRFEHWTYGCISTKNNYIEELYTYIPVGTTVVIKNK